MENKGGIDVRERSLGILDDMDLAIMAMALDTFADMTQACLAEESKEVGQAVLIGLIGKALEIRRRIDSITKDSMVLARM